MIGRSRRATAAIACGLNLMLACAARPCTAATAQTSMLTLFNGGGAPSVAYDPSGGAPFRNAAAMLQHDLGDLTGKSVAVHAGLGAGGGEGVIFGLARAPDIAALLRRNHIDAAPLAGQWETYGRAEIPAPWNPHEKALLIFGSDVRGTIWGVVDLSREMGVSAWQWWADVATRPVSRIAVAAALRYSKPPTVKYRGIFLNAGANGLNPWAGKTFDPAFGNIGPKTYARIYELMWRLKANMIWPAMTDADAVFNQTPGDAETAADWAIVRSSSHVEMLLRNNPHEWDAKTMGPYNWLVNRERMIEYWRGAVAKYGRFENLYTVGLRGADDFPMQGVDTPEKMADVLTDVIAEQRKILSTTLGKPADTIPQIFTPYKEVLAAYSTGRMSLPEDVTIDWPDDNFGYMMRLSDEGERKRSGGSGVYYHLTFWGRPYGYLWLGATDPSLIWEEMTKAYHFDARRFWVLNVGSIKPVEFLTQFFLALAFDADAFKDGSSVRAYLHDWVGRTFGAQQQDAITDILWRYYKLAFDRNPEAMGWNTTFPETAVGQTAFNMLDFGDENARRADAYRRIMQQAAAIAAALPADRKAAFFQLVQYPVDTAGNINLQQLDLDKSITYGLQHRASATVYGEEAAKAHDAILADAKTYNETMENGRWRHMIGTAPLDLPNYEAPHVPSWTSTGAQRCGIQVEGGGYFDGKGWWMPTLPLFHRELQRTRYFDLFTEQPSDADWSVTSETPWIKVDHDTGRFSAADKRFEQRVHVAIDWTHAPASGEGTIAVKCSAAQEPMAVHVRIAPPIAVTNATFMEADGIVSMDAAHADTVSGAWRRLDGLGHTGADLQTSLDMAPIDADDRTAIQKAPKLVYRFVTTRPDRDYSFPVDVTGDTATLRAFALPTFPITPKDHVRVALSIDGTPPQVLDFAAPEFGPRWREGVLDNAAVVSLHDLHLDPGAHQLTVFALDPGVTLDRFELDFGGASKAYGPVPETRMGT